MKVKNFITYSSAMTILTYGDRYHWELYSYYVEMWESSYFFAIWSSCSSRSLDNSCRKLWWCIEVGGEAADAAAAAAAAVLAEPELLATVDKIKDLSPALAILWLLDSVLLWPGKIKRKVSKKDSLEREPKIDGKKNLTFKFYIVQSL